MTTATLEDVLVAAGAKIVALAPETSGYLALAVADAAARLPLAIDDRSIVLGPEGTLTVPRRGDVIAPREAARLQRERLRRLLSVSAGSMPGLAAAAKARSETDVDAVAASIEGALIPLNRGAAKRAIARLARQMVELKESGHLPEPTSARPREPALVEPAERLPPVAPPIPGEEDEADSALAEAIGELSPQTPMDLRPRDVTPTILGLGKVGFKSEPCHASLGEPAEASFTYEEASATVLDPGCVVGPVEAPGSPEPSQAPTAASGAPPTPAKAPARAELAPATQSDVEVLLASFGVAESRDPLRVAASLKCFAGLEATAAPPIVWESPRPQAASALEGPVITEPAAPERVSAPPSAAGVPGRRSYRIGLGVLTALLTIGAVGVAALWSAHTGLLGTLLDVLP